LSYCLGGNREETTKGTDGHQAGGSRNLHVEFLCRSVCWNFKVSDEWTEPSLKLPGHLGKDLHMFLSGRGAVLQLLYDICDLCPVLVVFNVTLSLSLLQIDSPIFASKQMRLPILGILQGCGSPAESSDLNHQRSELYLASSEILPQNPVEPN